MGSIGPLGRSWGSRGNVSGSGEMCVDRIMALVGGALGEGFFGPLGLRRREGLVRASTATSDNHEFVGQCLGNLGRVYLKRWFALVSRARSANHEGVAPRSLSQDVEEAELSRRGFARGFPSAELHNSVTKVHSRPTRWIVSGPAPSTGSVCTDAC